MLFLKFSIFSGSENNLMELQERFSRGNLRLPSCFGAYDLLKAKQFKLLIYLRVFQSVRKQLPFPAPAANFIYLLVISLCEWHKSSFVYFLFLQITEALSFLHYSGQVIHKNVCPSSILVTKKGTWKLAGFEFIGKATTYFFFLHFAFSLDLTNDLISRTQERCHESDAVEPVVCQPWSTRLSKMAQPNLDYMGEWSAKSCTLQARRKKGKFLSNFDLTHERLSNRTKFPFFPPFHFYFWFLFKKKIYWCLNC